MTELSRLWDYVGLCGTMWDYVGRCGTMVPGLGFKTIKDPETLEYQDQVHRSWVSWDVELYLDWTWRGDAPMVNGNSKSILKRCGAMTTAFRSVQKLIFEAARRTVPKKANILWSTAFKTRLKQSATLQDLRTIYQPSKQEADEVDEVDAGIRYPLVNIQKTMENHHL